MRRSSSKPPCQTCCSAWLAIGYLVFLPLIGTVEALPHRSVVSAQPPLRSQDNTAAARGSLSETSNSRQRRRLSGAENIGFPHPFRPERGSYQPGSKLLGSTELHLFQTLRPEINKRVVTDAKNITKTNHELAEGLAVYLDRVYDFNNMFDWAAVVWDDWDLAPGFKGANGETSTAWTKIDNDCNVHIPPDICSKGGAAVVAFLPGSTDEISKSAMVLWRPTDAPSHDPIYILHLIMAVNECFEKLRPPIDLGKAGTCLAQGAHDEDALESPKAILLVPGSSSNYAAPEGGVFVFTSPFGSEPPMDDVPPLNVVILK